jgi:hypothetical protein
MVLDPRSWHYRRSLASRVTLLATMAVGLAVAVLAVAAYVTVRHQLLDTLDHSLRDRALAAAQSSAINQLTREEVPSWVVGAADIRIGTITATGDVYGTRSIEGATIQLAQQVLRDAGVEERAVFVGGDFFVEVPGECDRYLLTAIIHDWDDESCIKILRTIVHAMPPHARIWVLEQPVAPGDGVDFAKLADMMMLVYSDGGRERTQSEYESLFSRAGLRITAQTTLPSLFEVFELAPARM